MFKTNTLYRHDRFKDVHLMVNKIVLEAKDYIIINVDWIHNRWGSMNFSEDITVQKKDIVRWKLLY